MKIKEINMWPMYVDYTDDECKRVLRSLELEAYAAIISAFRAQGFLTKDKRKILQDLCNTLSISVERHRAEIRRAVNDEHLNTVAERLAGANTASDWAIEGRRVVPLMQRFAPHTAFTELANSAANAQATKNASLPLPGKTGLKEINNGIETMASRKRKELPTEPYIPPNKLQALDCQYPSSNVTPFESPISQSMDIPSTPEQTLNPSPSLPVEPMVLGEAPVQETSALSEYISSKIPPMAHVPSLVSPIKSTAKHIMLKSSTVTTFSSFDQMTTNLLASKPSSKGSMQTLGAEPHQPLVSEALKALEPKSLQRSSSTGAMRTTVIPHTIPSSGTSSTSSDRQSSSATPQSKFVSQLRQKSSVQGRQNLPSGLGVKLNIQPQISRSVSPKSAGNKMKQDSGSGFLTKKSAAGVFSPTTQPETMPPQFSASESLTITKTATSVQQKSPAKTESQMASSHQSASKVPVTKSLPKVSTSSSQYISRSLFGSGTKGAKSLPPVIFNVSSSATLQTPTKTTAPVQSEAGKTSSSQLLPKSTAIGVSQSHMKLGSSTTQTIQYRNDGDLTGLVRSARIINVTPPAGSRLPCSITPSAISALGLSSNLTTGALRVTLPAGTLNTSSAMRASAVAKPNVIVVHKAQMWPRPQGAAVIMSSTPVQRIPESIVLTEAQCKRNLLADVIEASGLVLDNADKPVTKEKGEIAKREKEIDSKQAQKSAPSLISESSLKTSTDSTSTPKTKTTPVAVAKTQISMAKVIESATETAMLPVSDNTKDDQKLNKTDKVEDKVLESSENVVTFSTMEIPSKPMLKRQSEDSKES